MSTARSGLGRKLRRIAIPLVILLVAATVFIYMSRTRPDAKPIEASEKSWTVDVEQVKPAAWSVSLTLYGKVDSLWSSTLAAGINADVLEVKAIEGDRVRKEDVLVTLDDRDSRLLLQQAEADVTQVRARIRAQQVRHKTDLATLPRELKLLQLHSDEVTRLRDLARKQVSSQSALDNARKSVELQAISVAKLRQSIDEHEPKMAELESSQARAMALQQKAELELERATVRAPFNGRVTSVLVAPGRRVRSGDALVEVFDTDALIVRALIPQRYLPIINQARKDDRELLVKGILDGQELVAALSNLTARVNTGSGGVEAIFQIMGDIANLQQGRLMELQLQLPEQPGLIALPHEALYGTNRIYRIDDGSRLSPLQVERVGETIDESGNSRVLIRSPELRAGEAVLATQLPSAVEGLLVVIADRAD